MCGHSHDGIAACDVADHHGIGTDPRVRPDLHGPEHLGPGADVHTLTDPRSGEVPRPQADGGPREDRHVAAQLRDAVDDDLAVREVQARGNDDGIADTDLREGHGADVAQTRHHRHTSAQGGNPPAVQDLSEESIGTEGESQRLGEQFRARQVGAPLSPVVQRHGNVGGDCVPKRRALGVAGTDPGAPLVAAAVDIAQSAGLLSGPLQNRSRPVGHKVQSTKVRSLSPWYLER